MPLPVAAGAPGVPRAPWAGRRKGCVGAATVGALAAPYRRSLPPGQKSHRRGRNRRPRWTARAGGPGPGRCWGRGGASWSVLASALARARVPAGGRRASHRPPRKTGSGRSGPGRSPALAVSVWRQTAGPACRGCPDYSYYCYYCYCSRRCRRGRGRWSRRSHRSAATAATSPEAASASPWPLLCSTPTPARQSGPRRCLRRRHLERRAGRFRRRLRGTLRRALS